jgi:hypothetical protein
VGAGVLLAAAATSGGGVAIELPGKFGEFRLVNRGPAIELSRVVKVQQRVGGEWRDTPVTNLYLTPSCASHVPECVSLGAKASLQPVPWSGNYCSSQCPANCNLDGPVPPGIYRYVATSCDRKHRMVSGAFEKKPPEAKEAPR